MSKYIGTPVVNISADTVDVTGDITTTDSTPEVTIVNNTHEDTDGGREGKVTFKGQQSGGEETTLAQIQASHDGTSDDEKGDLIFKTNDGSDGASPTERMRIDSLGNVGIGVTPKTGGSTWQHVQFGGTGNIIARHADSTVDAIFASNYYINSSDQDSYIATGDAARMFFNDDVISFSNAGSGSADSAISWNERLRITSDGDVCMGRTSLLNNFGDGRTSLALQGTGSQDYSTIQLANYGTGSNGQILGLLGFYDGTNENARVQGVRANATNSGQLSFYVSNAGTLTERMRIITEGVVQASDTGTYQTWSGNITGHQFQFGNQTGMTAHTINAGNSSYASDVSRLLCNRTNNSGYDFLVCTSGNLGDDEFRLRGDGNAFADGTWTAGGADYAEYFEWADGNSDDEDRVGFSVVLDNEKIRKATSSDDASSIIGIISANPSVVGDGDMDVWKHKYLRDDFGRFITDTHNVVEWTETIITEEETKEVKKTYEDWNIPSDVTVPSDATTSSQDINGKAFTHKRPNPDYNPDTEYVSREDRPEWATVGMMGKLRMRKGQPTGDRWIKMRDVSDTVEEWLVR